MSRKSFFGGLAGVAFTKTQSEGDFSSVENSVRLKSQVPRIANISGKSVSSEKLSINASVKLSDVDETEPDEVDHLALTSFDMWALGISIVIGGQYFAWNSGLHGGFGSLLIATILVAIGYISLIFCIAELSSSLPFAGGSYGIARVTLGFYPGFLVAYIDCGESVVYVAAVYLLGQMLTVISGAPRSFEPVYWVSFFLTSIAIHAKGGWMFWWLNRILAILSLSVILIYIIGAIGSADFDTYALMESSDNSDPWFRGGGMEFMRNLPLPCWFFVGVESINLACKDLALPKTKVPRGYISCVLTLFVTCFGVLFACCSQSPGVTRLMNELIPLNYGFMRIFNMSYKMAAIMTLPATYATASGFMFCFGRQLRAMGKSGLVNQFLGEAPKGVRTPVNALAAGSTIGLGVCFLMYHVESIATQVFNICILCALMSYATQFASFYVLRTKYSGSIKPEFTSPFGIPGAICGFFVFLLVFVAIAGFQDNFIAIITFLVYLTLLSGYYYGVARHRQFFSNEEKSVMFKAYLLKSNNARTNRLRKGKTLSARFINTHGSQPTLRRWALLNSGKVFPEIPTASLPSSSGRVGWLHSVRSWGWRSGSSRSGEGMDGSSRGASMGDSDCGGATSDVESAISNLSESAATSDVNAPNRGIIGAWAGANNCPGLGTQSRKKLTSTPELGAITETLTEDIPDPASQHT